MCVYMSVALFIFLCLSVHICIYWSPFLQDLVSDLQLAKKQTWEEKERLSALYEEQRKINLANRVGKKRHQDKARQENLIDLIDERVIYLALFKRMKV